jgi:NADPH-dependent curcumin reductase CurA
LSARSDKAHSFDYAKQYGEARKQIAEWLASGKLKRRFQIAEGLDNAPKALLMLYSGGNTGKMCAIHRC